MLFSSFQAFLYHPCIKQTVSLAYLVLSVISFNHGTICHAAHDTVSQLVVIDWHLLWLNLCHATSSSYHYIQGMAIK